MKTSALPRQIFAREGSARASGFTLIELLVVIAIIAILAAMLFARPFQGQGEGTRCRLPEQLEAGWPGLVALHGQPPEQNADGSEFGARPGDYASAANSVGKTDTYGGVAKLLNVGNYRVFWCPSDKVQKPSTR